MNDNDLATLTKENVQLRRHIEELRALLPTLRTEATALREQIAWQGRWIKELREAVAALTGPTRRTIRQRREGERPVATLTLQDAA